MNIRNVRAFARKEYYHLIRDFRSLYLAFAIPLLLILLFGYALSLDVENIETAVVDFDPAHVPGLFGIARMERELSAIFGGRKVDLRTAEDLSQYFRQDVLREAEVQYAQG